MSSPSRQRSLRSTKWLAVGLCAGLAVLLVIGHYLSPAAYGAQLGSRTLQLSAAETSVVTQYQLSFDLSTAGTLGSVLVQFCANDPLPDTPCTPPGGFDDSSAVLASQTGLTGFSISPDSTANQLILTRPPAPATIGLAQYDFTGVTNPSSAGSYYVRVQTFITDDASGPASDYGGIAFAITNDLKIDATVPPYLLFCTGVTIGGLNCADAAGDYIDFGELSPTHTRSGASQFLVATNAAAGYAVTVDGTTLTSGNNIINALASGDVSRPGVGQFGLNLRANATPVVGSDPVGSGAANPQPAYSQPNIYKFVAGDTLVAHPTTDEVRKYTASYIANIAATQAPGVYVSTLTYICLANF